MPSCLLPWSALIAIHTLPVRQGRGGALSVIALAERGAMFNPGPAF